ncbi:putative Type II secretion system protein K [uncultured Desulfobacterium sp.]|uniref:Putative Type II secretion system protein K n=1 Tax=uncultured Desulfobacterium sp. TaxID=201089 RepID=A0A445MSR2_9BACT|nr:putative Type II secretion system protein K [uncultured Desulfobacterium sp.]
MPLKRLFMDNRGFALIITIMILSLIVPMTLDFNTTTMHYKVSSANLKDGAIASSVAKSGYNLALAILFSDSSSSDFDSLHEPWADREILASAGSSMFTDAKLQLIIVDQSGKININSLVDEQGAPNTAHIFVLRHLMELEEFGIEEGVTGDIVNSILDWIDPDDDTTEEQGHGAEDSYYQGLREPYHCKNGPIETLDELLMVKGMTKEIFSRIARYLTIYGDGKININTAEEPVIMSLSEDIDIEIAAAIIDFRNDEKNDLSEPGWYKNVQGMGELSIDELITTASTHFEIISTGLKGVAEKTVRVMVERDQDELRVLSWKTG